MSKIPAAERTLSLLRLMAELGQPTTANRLAQKLEIPRSSCYQLLEVLESQGFAIHFTEDKRWGLVSPLGSLEAPISATSHWKGLPDRSLPSSLTSYQNEQT